MNPAPRVLPVIEPLCSGEAVWLPATGKGVVTLRFQTGDPLLTFYEKDRCIGLEPGFSVLGEAVLAVDRPAFGRLEGDFALFPTV